MVSHALRLLVRSDNRKLRPASVTAGTIFLMIVEAGQHSLPDRVLDRHHPRRECSLRESPEKSVTSGLRRFALRSIFGLFIILISVVPSSSCSATSSNGLTIAPSHETTIAFTDQTGHSGNSPCRVADRPDVELVAPRSVEDSIMTAVLPWTSSPFARTFVPAPVTSIRQWASIDHSLDPPPPRLFR